MEPLTDAELDSIQDAWLNHGIITPLVAESLIWQARERNRLAAERDAAVDAERERCAKIADYLSNLGPVDRPYGGDSGIEEITARNIARRIRSGEQP